MQLDRYQYAISTASPAARDAYVAGVDEILAGKAGDEECLARAISADPRCALAHAALARALFMRARMPEAKQAIARARELAASADDRERSHVHVLALPIEGRTGEALDATRAHLERWPADAMVAAPAMGVFGLFGFSGRKAREAELDQFVQWLAPHYDRDWWFDTAQAFAACECGRAGEARDVIERSLEAYPGNAHGAHVKAHVLYELREDREALAFLEAWMPGCAKEALMHCHLSWHVSVTALALGQLERAWAAYRAHVHPGGAWGPPLNVLTDSAAFLWRAELAGEARRAQLWGEVREHALANFPKAGVFFADLHAALAFVATGDSDGLQRLSRELRQRLAAGRLAPGEVVPDLVDALAAYGRQDWAAAIAGFERALPETVRVGGSRAQRDLVAKTLVAGCMKAGRPIADHDARFR